MTTFKISHATDTTDTILFQVASINGAKKLVTVSTTDLIAFQTVVAVCSNKAWFSSHQEIKVPKSFMTNETTSWIALVTVLLTASNAELTLFLNSSLVLYTPTKIAITLAITAMTARNGAPKDETIPTILANVTLNALPPVFSKVNHAETFETAPAIKLIVLISLAITEITPPIAIKAGPADTAISPNHFCQGASGRLSHIVFKTRTTLSLKVKIVSFKSSIKPSMSASPLPSPATRFSNDAFIDWKEPATVSLASFAVVPVIPSLS